MDRVVQCPFHLGMDWTRGRGGESGAACGGEGRVSVEKLSGEAGDALSRSICLPSDRVPSVSRRCLLYRRDAKFCSEVLFGLYTEAVNEQKKIRVVKI